MWVEWKNKLIFFFLCCEKAAGWRKGTTQLLSWSYLHQSILATTPTKIEQIYEVEASSCRAKSNGFKWWESFLVNKRLSWYYFTSRELRDLLIFNFQYQSDLFVGEFDMTLSLTGFLSGFTACTCCFHNCLKHEWNPVSFFSDGYCGKEQQGTLTRQLINWNRKDHVSCYFANHLKPTLKLRESIRFWKVCLPWYSPDNRLSETKRKFKATWVLDGFDAVSIE